MKTLDMRFIRYLNLFEGVTRIRTKDCFFYNNNIIFAVPKNKVFMAVGRDGQNVREISGIVKKRVRIISMPSGIEDAEKFILDIISPVSFNGLEINENELIINAGRQNKAALIGRNRVRLNEMREIVKQYFEKDFKIV